LLQPKKAQEIALASSLYGSPAIVRFLLEPAERTGFVTFGPVAAATRDAISSVPLDSSRRRSPYILNHKILCQYPVENGDREKNQKSQVFARLRCDVEWLWRSFMHRQGEAATCMKKRVLQIGLQEEKRRMQKPVAAADKTAAAEKKRISPWGPWQSAPDR
jgi:hypothetical protein